jgi:hypothetical protein
MSENVAVVSQVSAQGDVWVERVKALPAGVKLKSKETQVIVGHSETGHHHIVNAPKGVEWFHGADPGICFLVAENVDYLELTHHREWDTHAPQRLKCDPEGVAIWEFRQQIEHSPEGWRQVAD